MPNVLFADFDFPDIKLERDLFTAAGVSLIGQQCRTEDELIAAARDCKGILIQYSRITERSTARPSPKRE